MCVSVCVCVFIDAFFCFFVVSVYGIKQVIVQSSFRPGQA